VGVADPPRHHVLVQVRADPGAAGQMLLWAGAIRLAAELLGGMLR
jgi:hypothetical protein